MQGEVLKRVEKFKYLGSLVSKDGEKDSEVTHRARAGCMNWRKMSGVLHDKKISARVKGKLYKTTVRPAMIYGSETWPMKKSQERKFEVEEMKMLRWMKTGKAHLPRATHCLQGAGEREFVQSQGMPTHHWSMTLYL
nr:uncharacterized protein LOC113803967 [Penaeus vannamei]